MGAAADARRLALCALAVLVVRVALDRALALELHFDEAQWLARAFPSCQAVPHIIGATRSGVVVRVFVAHLCEGYRPVDWPAPQRY
jgi:hypothetical protein